MQLVNEKYSHLIDGIKASLVELSDITTKHQDYKLNSKLKLALENINNLFLIVFMGEFSTGKSSLINALIGETTLDEGITPTTSKITIIKYGDIYERTLNKGIMNISLPNEKFKNIYLVDTPGTNVTIEQHKKITEEFIPKADIIFFTIGAERAVTSSEYEFIKLLRDEWKKNIVFLLNKIDITSTDEELNELITYTNDELKRLFGMNPHLIPVSAKLAISGSDRGKSGFDELNKYLFDKLSEEERIRIKLGNALELSLDLSDEVEKTVNANLEKISHDEKKLSDFSSQIDGMNEDIIQNSSQFTERIRGRLLEFKNRGIEFIDNLIRFENVLKLIRKEKIAEEFENKVSMQTINEIEKDLDELVNWTEQSSKRMIDNAISFYRNSTNEENGDAVLKTSFMQNRMNLINTIRSELEIRKQQIDPKLIGDNLVNSARAAVVSVLGVQVGSFALGATVISAFSSFIVDITGILTTLAIMATAFAILPKKRSSAMKEFSEKVDNLTTQLISNINSQLVRNIDNVKLQVTDSLSPLRNFYRTQKKNHIDSRDKIEKIRKQLKDIREQLNS